MHTAAHIFSEQHRVQAASDQVTPCRAVEEGAGAMRLSFRALPFALLTLAAACGTGGNGSAAWNTMPNPTTHETFFPISSGSKHALGSDTPPITCDSCHGAASSFQQFDCLSCHQHADKAALDLGHRGIAGYNYFSRSCYMCHTQGTAGGAFPTGPFSDPNRNVSVNALIPSYVDTSIPSLSLQTAILPMPLDHASKNIDTTALGSCGNCHVNAGGGAYYPGVFHSALATLNVSQPTACGDCHASSVPTGFVGPTATNPVRTPPSSEMKHDAVLWSNGRPTATAAVPQDCGVCHMAPAMSASATWATGRAGTTPALYHASLAAAGLPQPASCVDCHANSRSNGVWTVASTNLVFDHTIPVAMADCGTCHQSSSAAAQWSSWAGGKYHLAGDATQATCLPCHAGERPTTTSNWKSATYASIPFDYGTNAHGVTHGAGQDCAVCHSGPGTGAWGGTQNWVGGTFTHGAGTLSSNTCISCHSSQLPDLLSWTTPAAMATLLNFDHSMNGTGDCSGCHQATVAANRYQYYYKPGTTRTLPGGDWQGGAGYPGATIGGVSVTGVAGIECAVCHKSPGNTWTDGVFHARIGAAVPQDCTVCHYTLMADAVRSDVTSGVNYAMKHAASQLSFQNCQVCHTAALSKSANTPIVSTLWQPALFHPSLASQPTACVVCHAVSTPAANAPTQSSVTYNLNLGSTSTNTVQWMNHGSNSVVGKDCVVCHAADAKTSGSAWSKSDSFHGHVSNAVSCKECHGLTNGGGSVAGTNNNLPVGITNSNTVTSAAADSTTGIPTGTLDQITHTEINVSSHDCNFCHSQQGVSTVAGVQGKEWAQANFHMSFTSTNPLVMNGSTGRCSNCHMNVRPGASFAFDHSTFTAAAGSQDCGSCHSWPGTATPATANWLGAAAAPDTVTLAGWASGTSITSNTVTFAHPSPSTYTSCAQCHAGTNFKTVIDYNHNGLTSKVTINGVAPAVMPNLGTSIYNASTNPTFCVACHNSKSPYVSKTGASSTITANTTSGSTTVTTGSTSTLTLGMTVTGTGIPSTTSTTSTFTASTTSGSTTVTTASPVSLSSGTAISGPGIPPNDTVATSVSNATSFILKAAATATATGVTLTATRTTPLTVTIKSITSSTAFVISSAANATVTGTTLTVTHSRIRQAAIGSHGGSTNGQDCTSCHAVGGRDHLTPPTPGVFGTGSISGG